MRSGARLLRKEIDLIGRQVEQEIRDLSRAVLEVLGPQDLFGVGTVVVGCRLRFGRHRALTREREGDTQLCDPMVRPETSRAQALTPNLTPHLRRQGDRNFV